MLALLGAGTSSNHWTGGAHTTAQTRGGGGSFDITPIFLVERGSTVKFEKLLSISCFNMFFSSGTLFRSVIRKP